MSFAACIIGLALAAAPALPPVPADGIRDDARVFATETKAALVRDMQDFHTATGVRLFIDTNTYLEGDINPGERCRQLVKAWCGGDPGAVICVDRASKPMHAIQISPALWERSSELEVMPAMMAAAELIGRSQVNSDGLAEGARTLMKRLTKLEKLARSRERVMDHSDQLLAGAFAGCLAVGGLAAWLLTRWLRRYEKEQAVEHTFPDVDVGQRFGAPNGGGVVVEISYRT